MKKITALLLLLSLPRLASAADPDQKEWISLFNGRDLTGWVPKITGYESGVNFGGRFGHLFYKTLFSHYVIAVEYRFVGEQSKDGPDWAFRNSGVMVHGQPVETMKKDQDFPISIEAQFLGGRGDGSARSTANLCTPGTNVVMNGQLETRHCINSSSKTFDGDQWVRVEVEVHGGGAIVHRVNGETVLQYEKPQYGGGNVAGHDPALKRDGEIITSGSISLQAESHPIEFRKVELLNLVGCKDKKAKNYKSYFEKDEPSACRF